MNFESVAGIVKKHLTDAVLAICRGHMRAVDNIVGDALRRLENAALCSEGIVYRAVIFIEQRVLAPCLFIAADKHIVGGIDKQKLCVALELLELDDGVEQIAERRADADIGNNGDLFSFFAGIEQKLRESRHKLRRHIIHAEIAYVFKRINNSRFSCTGQSGDDGDLHFIFSYKISR